MKKLMNICGVFVIALAAAGFAGAHCGSCDMPAANDGASCDKTAAKNAEGCDTPCDTTAAKAAYDSSLEKTGCEKSAKEAYVNTLAQESYTKAYNTSSCSKTASKAAYDTVLADTGCSKTATGAARHAVAQAAYDETFEKTGCSKTSKAAYDTAMQASTEIKLADEKTAS